MKELFAPHWLLGGSLSIGGGLAYRFGDRLLSGSSLTVCKIAGLALVTMGLFVVMRGVSGVAQKRPPLEADEIRRIPQLRQRKPPPDDKS